MEFGAELLEHSLNRDIRAWPQKHGLLEYTLREGCVWVLCLRLSSMLNATPVNRNFTRYAKVQVVGDTFVY
jgi:hypothetical protein